MMKENQGKFCTVPEAAQKFGVDRKTMYRWVTTGKIHAIVTPGGHHRIPCSEIDHLLENNGFSKYSPDRQKKILVVDDEASVRKTLEKHLSRENFIVATVPDGFQAGLKAREMIPDLIILDLMMEGIDGFAVCQTLKSDPILQYAKILVMTGYDTPENQEKAMQMGADGYLSKQESLKLILNRINVLLKGNQSGETNHV